MENPIFLTLSLYNETTLATVVGKLLEDTSKQLSHITNWVKNFFLLKPMIKKKQD